MYQPPTQWDLDIGSIGRADSNKKSVLKRISFFAGKNKHCGRGWDMGLGRKGKGVGVNEFRGGVLYL